MRAAGAEAAALLGTTAPTLGGSARIVGATCPTGRSVLVAPGAVEADVALPPVEAV
jgi:hypothetical protein